MNDLDPDALLDLGGEEGGGPPIASSRDKPGLLDQFGGYLKESADHLARIPGDVDKAIAEGALGKVSRDYLSDVNKLHEGEMSRAELANFAAMHMLVSPAHEAKLVDAVDRVGKGVATQVEREVEQPERIAYDLPPHAHVHAGMVEARLAGHAWGAIHEHLNEMRSRNPEVSQEPYDPFAPRDNNAPGGEAEGGGSKEPNAGSKALQYENERLRAGKRDTFQERDEPLHEDRWNQIHEQNSGPTYRNIGWRERTGMAPAAQLQDRTSAVVRRSMVESSLNQNSSYYTGIPEMALANIPIKSNRDTLLHEPFEPPSATMPNAGPNPTGYNKLRQTREAQGWREPGSNPEIEE